MLFYINIFLSNAISYKLFFNASRFEVGHTFSFLSYKMLSNNSKRNIYKCLPQTNAFLIVKIIRENLTIGQKKKEILSYRFAKKETKSVIKNKNIEIIINTSHLLFAISFKREPLTVVSKRSK